MANAPLVLETALLLLLAYLAGCLAGHLLRRLATRRRRHSEASAPLAVAASATAALAPLVVAPTIHPLPVPARPTSRRTAAQRLAAAADDGPVEASMASPAAAPAIAPEIQGNAAVTTSGAPAGDMPSPTPAAAADDSEAAAMRAVEGAWHPAPMPPGAGWRAELPEGIELDDRQRQAVPEAAAASPADITAALASVHSAVAAAEAAASAALASAAADAPRPAAVQRIPFGRPPMLDAPRAGGPDVLRRITGITPQLETALNDLGIFHFDQIAAWDRKAEIWVDQHLALRGRAGCAAWVAQARQLAGNGRQAVGARRRR